MKALVRKIEQISIIDCSGDVDLYSSPQLRETLLKEMRSGVQNVLINMADVPYIDSSGIATLVEGLQLSRETKTHFGLFGLRSNARSVLELARLHKVFPLFDNEKDAVERISTIQPFGGL